MRGVTQRTYDAYRRANGRSINPVRNITEQELRAIYRIQYWDKVMGDQLPPGIDYAMFDYAVNSGPSRAVRDMQRVMGFPAAQQDGIMGYMTLAAIRERNPENLIRLYVERRMQFLRSLRHWNVFGRGWSNRVLGRHAGYQDTDTGVLDVALNMASAGPDKVERVEAPSTSAGLESEAGVQARAPEHSTSVASDVKTAATDPVAMPGVLGTLLSSILAAATTPPLSYAASFALVLIVLTLVYLTIHRRYK